MSRTPAIIFRSYIHKAKFTLFLTDHLAFNETRDVSSEVTIPEVCLGILSFLVTVAESVTVYYIDLVVVITCLTLWNATRSFTKFFMSIENKNSDSRDGLHLTMMKEYRVLKNLSDSLNNAMGQTILFYSLETMLFYALNLDQIFVQIQWYSRLVFFMFMASTTTSLKLAAGTCHEVSKHIREELKNGVEKLLNY